MLLTDQPQAAQKFEVTARQPYLPSTGAAQWMRGWWGGGGGLGHRTLRIVMQFKERGLQKHLGWVL